MGTPLGEVASAFSGGPAGAREVLGTIAGGMITIAGVSFSVVVIALVLASNQFSPRVLRNFTRDGYNQATLGVFVGTFVYAVLVLRSIRGGEEAYVPAVGVALGIGLAIASLGFFIYFIHHIASNIQVSMIVRNVAEETRRALDDLFDRERALLGGARVRAAVVPVPDGPRVTSDADGYVERIDVGALVQAARATGVTLRLLVGPGDFVARGAPLGVADRPPEDPDALADRVRNAFVIGRQRTLTLDPAFGFRELVDVAVKAISPAMNDPNTACNCIDYLGALLRDLADRDFPASDFADEEGVVRVRAPTADFADYVDLACAEIRRYGARDLAVTLRLLDALGGAADATGREDRLDALWAEATSVLAGARDGIRIPADRDRVNAAVRRLAATLDRDPGPLLLPATGT